MIMINLIGEQPIPNLLPILYFKPAKNIILYSDTTLKVGERLEKILDNCKKYEVEPYNIQGIKNILNEILDPSEEYIFNITGGTKIMSVALYQVALENKFNFIYFQSEGNQSILYKYKVNSDSTITNEKIILPELINIDIYLRAHLPDYITNNSNEQNIGFNYERSIVDILKRNNFEVTANIKPKGEGNQLEIDAVIRLKGTNRVGIAEIKIGDQREEGPKKGIDQLALAGQREYLGTYTHRFLITSRVLSKQIKELAIAHRISVIDEIEQNRNNNNLNDQSINKLLQRIKEKLS